MVVVGLHVREPGGEVETADRVDERVPRQRSDDGPDELEIFRERVADVGEPGAERGLALHDELVGLDREGVGRAVEHLVLVHDVVDGARVRRVDIEIL